MPAKIIKKIQDMKQEMTRWRQRLHQEPELAFDEQKTSRFIIRQLKTFGLDDVFIMSKTGVIGVLHGKSGAPQPGSGKAIMLRAEMDALPILEASGVVHASRTQGVHHACGHDGHMAMLLGAAKHLAETRDFEGTVYFVFQPAEEHIGGAKQMVKDGFFSQFPCDEVYALHNFPGLPLGAMATTAGPMLAASDEFHVSFKGQGGHNARIENTTDIVAAMAEAVTAIKAMAKGLIQGPDAALTICSIHTETEAPNVLPAHVDFSGSIRTFDRGLHESLKDGVSKIVADVAARYGAEAKLEFKNPYPMLVNSKVETDFAASVAQELLGAENVITTAPKTLGVEDFAAFLEQKPGNFMALGTGRTDGKAVPELHTAKYDFNDAASPIGASYWVMLVEKALPVVKRPEPGVPGPKL